MNFEKIISDFSSHIWGYPLLLLIIGGGIYLLVISKFIPFRYIPHAFNILRGNYKEKQTSGKISHFKALSTALSATIGMGNIAGVAVAISIGGPGSIFWMWVSALIGMSTKFYTSSLAVMYRGKNSVGKKEGGPMYFIVNGLGKKWISLAIIFSLCGMIGALPVFNVNQLTSAIENILIIPHGFETNIYSKLTIGFCLVIITSVVIIGGLKRISKIASKVVPLMVLVYLISVILIIVINNEKILDSFKLIFTDAFEGKYYNGDAILGGSLGAFIIYGIRRGVFSNEAGIGMAPMAHGEAKTDNPIKEGLVAMLGPAIDTILVCTLTAMAILTADVWEYNENCQGIMLTAHAFETSLGFYGNYIILICAFFFCISSLFSYSYYGSKCLSFIAGETNKNKYNYIYIFSIMIGATTSLSAMLNLIDIFFALMAIPTMIATIILAPKVVKKLEEYG